MKHVWHNVSGHWQLYVGNTATAIAYLAKDKKGWFVASGCLGIHCAAIDGGLSDSEAKKEAEKIIAERLTSIAKAMMPEPK